MSYGGRGGVHLIGFAIVSNHITLAESLLLWDAAFSCEVKAKPKSKKGSDDGLMMSLFDFEEE